MEVLLSKVRWGRVLLAGVAPHLINVVLAVVVVFGYALLTVGPQGRPEGDSQRPIRRSGGTWSVPVLTIFATAWVVRELAGSRGASVLA